MWARVFEFALALWLAMSPFIFGHAAHDAFLWVNDYVSAILIGSFALLSYKRRLPAIHLLNIVMGLWLIGIGALRVESPPPPAMQNHVVVGLLLLMFAVVPSYSRQPPGAWRAFMRGD